MTPHPVDGDAHGPAFVSTGALPSPEHVQELVDEAYRRFRGVDEGAVSQVYPRLALAAPERFGLAVAGVSGVTVTAGECSAPFTIMSVAKPFVFALVCRAIGAAQARARVGANATGLPFDSLAAVERSADGRTNPMVNAGAIATAGLIPGRTLEQRWRILLDGLSDFAGHELALDQEVLASASASNHRNRAIAQMLRSVGVLRADPDETVELYTRQSCVAVTAVDLAVMGATLADAGVHPVSGARVVDQPTCHAVLSVMLTAGLYESSGDWLYDIGLPGKSGIGGGIVTVAPGKGALGTFSPPLDAAGNSVRGTLAATFLSRALGMDLLASAPAPH